MVNLEILRKRNKKTLRLFLKLVWNCTEIIDKIVNGIVNKITHRIALGIAHEIAPQIAHEKFSTKLPTKCPQNCMNLSIKNINKNNHLDYVRLFLKLYWNYPQPTKLSRKYIILQGYLFGMILAFSVELVEIVLNNPLKSVLPTE